MPSPVILTSILWRLFISNVITSSYLMHSLGVNEIGIFNTLNSFIYIKPFLSFEVSTVSGKITWPGAKPTSKYYFFSNRLSILIADKSLFLISKLAIIGFGYL